MRRKVVSSYRGDRGATFYATLECGHKATVQGRRKHFTDANPAPPAFVDCRACDKVRP